MIRGSCLCGGVAYEIDGRVSPIQLCHARRCRKMSASAFRAEAAVKAEALRFVRGEELITVYEAPILREPPAFRSRFCKVCGTPLPGELEGTGFAVVFPSAFDGEPELTAFRHIFVSQNAAWHEIADDLPQFAERPPESERLPQEMKPMRLFAVPLLLAAAALPPAPSVAAPRCEVFVLIDVPGEDQVNEQSVTDSTCTASGQSGPAFLIGDGGADYGVLHAHSEATFLDGETTNLTTTHTKVEFRDTITLDSPGLAGQIGQIHAAVFLDGFIDVTGSANGSMFVDLLSPFGSSMIKFVQCGGGGVCNGQFPPTFFAESLPMDFSVRFGEPSTFAVQLVTSVGRNTISTAPGTADLDFGSTATWSGIQEVTFGGDPVPFTVVSESGTDWTLPVPEPSQGVLLVVGASVLRLARRPRRLERGSR